MDKADNTLDDFPEDAFGILAFCDGCGRQVALDRAKLPEGVTIPGLRARLRCASCGSRACSIRIVYRGSGGFRHRG